MKPLLRERDLDRMVAELFDEDDAPAMPCLTNEDYRVIRRRIPLTNEKKRPRPARQEKNDV